MRVQVAEFQIPVSVDEPAPADQKAAQTNPTTKSSTPKMMRIITVIPPTLTSLVTG
jgi:hypothetical protein